MTNLTAEERIKRCQINLWKDKPFWAYLSYKLTFHEAVEEWFKERGLCPSMCVDINGNIYYNKKWINKLNDEELRGVIAHEVSHLIWLSELRKGSRDEDGWNISTDICINSLLARDNFILPKGVLVPDYNDEVKTGFGKKIKKCSEKIAEEIYDELPRITIDKNGNIYVSGGKGKKKEKIGEVLDGGVIFGKGKGEGKGGKDKKKGKGGLGDLTSQEKREIENKWKDALVEAHTIGKMRGNVPAGLERLIGKLHEEKIDWRTLLQRYIMNAIPYNHSYRYPHKKSVSIGTYMPDIVKEKINVSIVVDLSGSIGQEEYTDFVSEIMGLARAFQEKITMKFYSHDTSAYEGGTIENGNLEKIENLKLKGGGGTSHQEVFNLIKEKEEDCKCVIFLTDGYSDLESIKFEEYDFDKLFVISKGGDDGCLKGKPCQIINLKD